MLSYIKRKLLKSSEINYKKSFDFEEHKKIANQFENHPDALIVNFRGEFCNWTWFVKFKDFSVRYKDCRSYGEPSYFIIEENFYSFSELRPEIQNLILCNHPLKNKFEIDGNLRIEDFQNYLSNDSTKYNEDGTLWKKKWF